MMVAGIESNLTQILTTPSSMKGNAEDDLPRIILDRHQAAVFMHVMLRDVHCNNCTKGGMVWINVK